MNNVQETYNISNNSIAKEAVYYVIDDICDKNSGFFCHYIYLLPYIKYALDKGYIPIVDMKHNRNQYFKDGREYKDNVWEYFFKQPGMAALEELSEDSNFIISDERDVVRFPIFDVLKDIKKSRTLYGKYLNLTEFNDETKAFLEEKHNILLNGESEVLGILCRGTDYLNTRPYDHVVQPDPTEVINKAKDLQKKYNYKKIWLATEDKRIYNMFKQEFGDMLIENNQYLYSFTSDKLLNEVQVDRENHFYKLAKEYLQNIYILSKCKYVICGYTAGTVGAWCLSEGFKNQSYVYIWNTGRYRIKTKLRYSNLLQKIFSIQNRLSENKKYKVITVCGFRLSVYVGKNKNITKEYIK